MASGEKLTMPVRPCGAPGRIVMHGYDCSRKWPLIRQYKAIPNGRSVIARKLESADRK